MSQKRPKIKPISIKMGAFWNEGNSIGLIFIAFPKVPTLRFNHCMERIIDELCNVDSKFDKLTDYILIIILKMLVFHFIYGIILIQLVKDLAQTII